MGLPVEQDSRAFLPCGSPGSRNPEAWTRPRQPILILRVLRTSGWNPATSFHIDWIDRWQILGFSSFQLCNVVIRSTKPDTALSLRQSAGLSLVKEENATFRPEKHDNALMETAYSLVDHLSATSRLRKSFLSNLSMENIELREHCMSRTSLLQLKHSRRTENKTQDKANS